MNEASENSVPQAKSGCYLFKTVTRNGMEWNQQPTWPGSAATTGTPGIHRAPSFFPMMAARRPPQIFTPQV